MSDRSDALQSGLKKIAADLAARGPVPYEAPTAKVSMPVASRVPSSFTLMKPRRMAEFMII